MQLKNAVLPLTRAAFFAIVDILKGGGFVISVFVWLAFLIAFVVAEALTVALVSVWFAVGALCACLLALAKFSVAVQIGAFCVVSGAMLAALRPFAGKFLKPHITATNVDSVIGTVGVVTAPVDNRLSCGQVKLGAMEWSARSTTGEPIAVGETVKVDKVEGVKVFVTAVHAKV